MSKLGFALLKNSILVTISAVVGDILCQRTNLYFESKANKENNNNNNNIAVSNLSPHSNSLPTKDTKELTENETEKSMTILEFYEKAKTGHKFFGWWDLKRTTIMGINGFFVLAPIGYGINQKLEKLFPGKEFKQIMKKMITLWCVVPFTISISFMSVGFLNGGTMQQAENKIKADLLTTMLMGAGYWPFINFLNFRLVHVDYRPVFGSIAASVWQIYMSNQINKPVKTEDLVVERY